MNLFIFFDLDFFLIFKCERNITNFRYVFPNLGKNGREKKAEGKNNNMKSNFLTTANIFVRNFLR